MARQSAQSFAHTVMHAQGLAHHHHEDLSVHVGHAGEEPAHLHADEGVQPAALPSVMTAVLPGPPVLAAGNTADAAVTSMCLEGLLRPPRAAA